MRKRFWRGVAVGVGTLILVAAILIGREVIYAGLMIAVQRGDAKRIGMLASRGINVNHKYGRWGNVTPLISAAGSEDSNAETVKALLAAGARVNDRDDLGFTALIAAALEGNADIVRLLLAHGADSKAANIKGDTALHFAAGDGRMDICRLLIGSGANAHQADNKGRTPIDVALKNGHEEIASYLSSSAKADPRVQ